MLSICYSPAAVTMKIKVCILFRTLASTALLSHSESEGPDGTAFRKRVGQLLSLRDKTFPTGEAT